jgi:hypothetical protein
MRGMGYSRYVFGSLLSCFVLDRLIVARFPDSFG